MESSGRKRERSALSVGECRDVWRTSLGRGLGWAPTSDEPGRHARSKHGEQRERRHGGANRGGFRKPRRELLNLAVLKREKGTEFKSQRSPPN